MQVRQVELHPVQPWIAVVSKSDLVSIWDWSTREVRVVEDRRMGSLIIVNVSGLSTGTHGLQVVHQFQLGAMGEEDMCGDADLARLHAMDPAYSVNPSVGTSTTSR